MLGCLLIWIDYLLRRLINSDWKLKFGVRVHQITFCRFLSPMKQPITSVLNAVFVHALQSVLGISLCVFKIDQWSLLDKYNTAIW